MSSLHKAKVIVFYSPSAEVFPASLGDILLEVSKSKIVSFCGSHKAGRGGVYNSKVWEGFPWIHDKPQIFGALSAAVGGRNNVHYEALVGKARCIIDSIRLNCKYLYYPLNIPSILVLTAYRYLVDVITPVVVKLAREIRVKEMEVIISQLRCFISHTLHPFKERLYEMVNLSLHEIMSHNLAR